MGTVPGVSSDLTEYGHGIRSQWDRLSLNSSYGTVFVFTCGLPIENGGYLLNCMTKCFRSSNASYSNTWREIPRSVSEMSEPLRAMVTTGTARA